MSNSRKLVAFNYNASISAGLISAFDEDGDETLQIPNADWVGFNRTSGKKNAVIGSNTAWDEGFNELVSWLTQNGIIYVTMGG